MQTIAVIPTTDLAAILAAQKAAQAREGTPSIAVRRERLERCIRLLTLHADDIVSALNDDFGARSKNMSLLADIVSAVAPLKHARAHVAGWARNEPRSVELMLRAIGARAELRFQPKGVVGIMAPWNFPVQLIFAPLAGVLAAGNRAMIKPSELTPKTSALIARLFRYFFSPEEIAVVTGGADVGRAFAKLPFDHLVFTGGTEIGRDVMRSAAENLTPVTLELGGKSPVILGRSADIEKAANRIMAGKTMNAGQICLAPDYLIAPVDKIDAFVTAAHASISRMYPKLRDDPDYTAIISQRHYERVTGLVADARAKGAQVIEINPARQDFSQQEHRKIPPTLILGVNDDMRVMQEEIFGPVLPIKTYNEVREAVDYVNAHPRPLGLYYFGEDATECDAVVNQTTSGGVTINDVIFHVSAEDLPFGGIGPSGMGAYHGRDGFLEFSHKKAVYRQSPSNLLAAMHPPYGERFKQLMGQRLK